jgi:dUTP pyrophosphatase
MARVNIVRPEAQFLSYATTHSAGLDLVACIEDSKTYLYPGKSTIVPTGISLELEDDQVALVYPRSGLGIKYGIALRNGTGVIDADYKGEVIVCLTNQSESMFVLEKGMRVAQLVLTKYERFENVKIDEVVRGTGGFGSTGA